MTPPARPDPVAALHPVMDMAHSLGVSEAKFRQAVEREGYVLVNADMLAAAIGSLPSPPSVLHPEESAAAILAALESQP